VLAWLRYADRLLDASAQVEPLTPSLATTSERSPD
jgi:hypothetical protein